MSAGQNPATDVAIPVLTVDDPSPAVLAAAASFKAPEAWWAEVSASISQVDGGTHSLWVDADHEARQLQMEQPGERLEKLAWLRSYSWTKTFITSSLPTDIVNLEPITRIIGPHATGKVDLYLSGQGIANLIRDLQSREAARAPDRDAPAQGAEPDAPAQGAEPDAPAQGAEPGGPTQGRMTPPSEAMRSVHFSEPEEDSRPTRSRPQPSTRSKVSRNDRVSDATAGRVTPALPSEFSQAGDSDHGEEGPLAEFDSQGVTTAELSQHIPADCCAICGANHFSGKCKARIYHEQKDLPPAQQQPVIASLRQRSARDKTTDLYIATAAGDKRVCKALNVFGRCEKDCSRLHACSLCARPGHGAHICPTYRSHLLGAARDRILASRIPAPPVIPPPAPVIPPPALPVVPEKWFTVTVAPPQQSKVEDRFPGPASYGCIVREGDFFESWPRVGDADYPGPPQTTLLELLARHALTDEDFGRAKPNHTMVYPAVPQIYLRPGVKLHLEADDFVAAAGQLDSERVSKIITNASVEPTKEEYTLARQRYRNGANVTNKHAQVLEKLACNKIPGRSKPYFPSHFNLSASGISEASRLQIGDGVRNIATAHLVFHYPSAHQDTRQLTPQAFATNLVRGHLLIPPGEVGGQRNLASFNRYPVKSLVVEEAGPRVRLLNGETTARPYPHEIKRHFDEDLFHFYAHSVQDGRSHLVVTFGAASTDLFVGIQKLLNADQIPFIRHGFEVIVPSLADWEMGIDCAELSALREESRRDTRTWLDEDELFGMHTGLAKDERNRPSHMRVKVKINCTLFYRVGSPENTGVLFIEAPHPQNADLAVCPASDVQVLDFVVDFFAAAVRNTLGSAHRPPPKFAFSTHHTQVKFERSTTIPAKTRTGLALLNYGPSQAGLRMLAERLDTVQKNLHFGLQKAVFSESSLPQPLRKLAGRAKVSDAASVDPAKPPPYTYLGVESNYVQHVKFVLSLDLATVGSKAASVAAQARRQAGVTLPRSAAQSTQNQAAVAAATLAHIATSNRMVIGEEYDSICQCGIVGKNNQYDKQSGRPLATSTSLTPRGKHPPNSSRDDYGSCWMGIPLRDDLRARLMLYRSRGNVDPTAQEQATIVDGPMARYRSGQPAPTPLSAEELDVWDKARRVTLAVKKKPTGPTQAGATQVSSANPNPTGQTTLSISSTGVVTADRVPHAESSAAAQARAARQALNSDDLDA